VPCDSSHHAPASLPGGNDSFEISLVNLGCGSHRLRRLYDLHPQAMLSNAVGIADEKPALRIMVSQSQMSKDLNSPG